MEYATLSFNPSSTYSYSAQSESSFPIITFAINLIKSVCSTIYHHPIITSLLLLGVVYLMLSDEFKEKIHSSIRWFFEKIGTFLSSEEFYSSTQSYSFHQTPSVSSTFILPPQQPVVVTTFMPTHQSSPSFYQFPSQPPTYTQLSSDSRAQDRRDGEDPLNNTNGRAQRRFEDLSSLPVSPSSIPAVSSSQTLDQPEDTDISNDRAQNRQNGETPRNTDGRAKRRF